MKNLWPNKTKNNKYVFLIEDKMNKIRSLNLAIENTLLPVTVKSMQFKLYGNYLKIKGNVETATIKK